MMQIKCNYCESQEVESILNIRYVGCEIKHKTILYCSECGLVFQDECEKALEREYKDAKSRYLGECAKNFLNNNLVEKCQYVLDYAHIDVSQLNSGKARRKLLVISDYLEHVEDVQAEIKNIGELDMEYIYLQVPVWDILSEFPFDLYGFFIEEHNYYFSLNTLRSMMENIGYCLVAHIFEKGEGFKMPMIFPSVLSLWKKVDSPIERDDEQDDLIKREIANYLSGCDRYLRELNDFLKEIQDGTRLAIWGTSNFLQKMLGMSELSKKNIVCFYDNNSNLWGKEILGKPIVKYSAQDYESRKVEKILIASNTVADAIFEELVNVHLIPESNIIRL